MGSPFELKTGIRKAVPLWIGVGGPSGGGKTKSALRLATGIVKVTGGRIAVIDTEADRALAYAPTDGQKANPPDSFDFDHISFGPPFSSTRYLEAAEFAISKGARVLIFDSFSHEHESIGGLLEQFEEELERLSRGDEKKAERVKFLAWKKPKMERRRMINGLLQSPVSIIGCFRTQSKLALQKGEDPVKLGYMPITGAEFIYEFPTRMLMLPGSDGSPGLPQAPGEKEWVRVPAFFRGFIKPDAQLTEAIGEQMAKWSLGGQVTQLASGPAIGGNVDRERLQQLADLRAKLNWSTSKASDWRRDLFGESDPTKFTAQQLDDAITLMQSWSIDGADAYEAELATLAELGRVKMPEPVAAAG